MLSLTILVLLSFLIMVLTGKLFAVHTIHSPFITCKHRASTKTQLLFSNIPRYCFKENTTAKRPPRNNLLTLDFTPSEGFTITLPVGSQWQSVLHTHLTDRICIEPEVPSGKWYLGDGVWERPGKGPCEYVGKFYDFGRKYGAEDEEGTVLIRGNEMVRQVKHVLASALQDAEVYIYLCSTPFWVWGLYNLFSHLGEKRKEWFVQRVVWMQLRTIFYENDIWEHHGTCEIWRWTYWLIQPEWVWQWNKWTRILTSQQATKGYWHVGGWIGMEGWYEEYELEIEGVKWERKAKKE